MNKIVSRTRSRAALVLLLLVFAAPVILAWLVFFVFPEFRPTDTMNHGELVVPARPLPAFHLQGIGTDTVDQNFLRGKWTFVYLAEGACEKPCVDQLYKMRQVRLTQGKNIKRLQRLFLWNTEGIGEAQRLELAKHFPGLVIGNIQSGGQADSLINSFRLEDGADPYSSGRLYLVDPMGNLMMSYEPDTVPRGITKDLERLLKYSGLG
ncbi:cytochrome oxidase Cu insertion factor (SCO1/SenC/PrrC family) [Thiogranum longum]|uniref:Cytochrome oxidase Cu insertion factor (SCO1/SenC/PrrC family) n=1 Tax=Thiogranum longum TaxID=1537524 RepID=A0A4R1HIP7_9GAMM|nr:hypothetical protein [Thiogranum longum]TCK17082.1 cytochrome oxidase Cu insertion factor (SCO1/SenC/PrrC family) [Thiogranum longum]